MNKNILNIQENDYYFIIKKNIFKERIHLAGCFHKDGTIWSNGDKYIEIINNQEIKTKIIIPILNTNIKKDELKQFYFPYIIKDQSLKNIESDTIILVYTNNNNLKVAGNINKSFNIVNNNYIESIYSNNSKNNNNLLNEYDDNNLININDNSYNDNKNTITISEIIFIDEYDLSSITFDKLYHTINISEYSYSIGYFTLPFNELLNFINKINIGKCSKIKLEYLIESNKICLNSYSNCLHNTNNLLITYNKRNNIKIDDIYFLDIKLFQTLKNINVIMLNNKKKDKKIYNNISFEIIYYKNIFKGLNIKPNNIDIEDNITEEYISSECFFIFIPFQQ